jgi:hypothetical protein
MWNTVIPSGDARFGLYNRFKRIYTSRWRQRHTRTCILSSIPYAVTSRLGCA